MESSSDEAEFGKEAAIRKQEEEEEAGEGRRRAVKKRISYAEDDGNIEEEEEDSDDDIPLAALAAKAKKSTKNSPKKKSSTKKKPAPPARKTSNLSTSSDKKKYEFASAALYQSESLKGLLVQRLLCRWWYAYQWPDPASLPAKPPKNYDALDGFPGVYVCSQGDDVGKIMDCRDKDQCPSFRNFASKPSSELKDLLLKALENQKAQLIEHEGADSPVLADLDKLTKWAKKVDPTKADKQALKVLKASQLTL